MLFDRGASSRLEEEMKVSSDPSFQLQVRPGFEWFSSKSCFPDLQRHIDSSYAGDSHRIVDAVVVVLFLRASAECLNRFACGS